MPAFEAVLFDLDGTLADTAPDFYVTLHELCDRYGRPRLPEDLIRDNVSDGSRVLTKLCFPDIDADEFEERRQELLNIYEGFVGNETRLFPEMRTIIKTLDQQSISWGIVTNKPRLYTELLLQRTGMAAGCATLICADDLPRAKPHPDGILKACENLFIDPSQCIYVGDHERDIIAGRDAGCVTACVSFGYFHGDTDIDAWGPDLIIHTAEDLLRHF